jgi:DnaJ family protein B protein 4
MGGGGSGASPFGGMGGGMGSMGGMPGMPGMGGMGGGGVPGGFDFGGGGMPGMQQQRQQSGRASPEGPKDVEKRLPCSLEELYAGAERKLKVGRVRGGEKEEQVLHVNVAKGWKAVS